MGDIVHMRHEVMKTIWLNVVNGVGQHGDFLRTFGLAYTRADPNNQVILYGASVALIGNYKLDTYEYTTAKIA